MSGKVLKQGALMIIFLSSFFIISSCQENDETFTSETVGFYQSEENIESVFGLINSIANEASQYAESTLSGRVAGEGEFACAIVDFEGTKDMGRIDIDYGTGCKGPDGRIKKGKMVVEYSGKRIFYGSVVYVVLTDFYVDDHKIEGTVKSENISTDPERPKFRVTITNGKYFGLDHNYTSWQSDRIHTWTYSPDFQSLTIDVTGTSYGRTQKGDEFSVEIVEPLIYTSECIAAGNYLPVQGSKKITLYSQEEILAEYGSGTCDKEVTLTINDKTEGVYL